MCSNNNDLQSERSLFERRFHEGNAAIFLRRSEIFSYHLNENLLLGPTVEEF